FRDQQVTGTADKDGKWLIKLKEMKGTQKQEGSTLTVAGKKKPARFKDVLVGEVWLCAGQSNMQWSLSSSDARDDIAAANFPAIRHVRGSGWAVCSPKTA